jgi:uncharacterized protein Yka (UPF0111/DUF47 family)
MKYFYQNPTQTILAVPLFVHALQFAGHKIEGKRIMNNDIIFNEVDQLGELLGEIKRLQDRADAIKAKLKDKLRPILIPCHRINGMIKLKMACIN